ncbi:NUDIX hydrolase [Frankia sp. CcI49]|uniref:hypothetical protein n=1 Tax=unclassified Frankia TaxID=2632575 RepID=UPI0006CA1360|nr:MULTISPECIES: hypothetical protein [unclassified Frankia]KPM56471.1 NUDIX hydrolase [Frankia sp. R43]ONH62101.1 NUDIX hydrolase [Frankia sp. CcI49]
MYPTRSLCHPVDLRLMVVVAGTVFLIMSGASEGSPTPEWRLPAASLRLGEPARETALRLAADAAAPLADEAALTLAHTAHHRIGGEERMTLYFLLDCTAKVATATAVTAATTAREPAGRPGQACWRPLIDLPAGLDRLDDAVLVAWQHGEAYSEPGWHPVRPPSPSSLSPLEELRAH